MLILFIGGDKGGSMVLTLNGNSVIGAHVKSYLRNLICGMHLKDKVKVKEQSQTDLFFS